MAEKQVEVDTIATFSDDDYGWIEAHQRKTVRADVGERWISEGKALLVLGVIETPEDGLPAHETADVKRRRTL